jgi:thiol:disulfide interchange protein
MKNCLLIAAALAVFSAAAFAQGSGKAASAPAQAAKPKAVKEGPFPREKFDPAKNPALDLTAAQKTAAKTRRNIVLDVGGEWCGWCVYMDKFFFNNPDLAKLRDENFVWVKVNFSPENKNETFLAAYPERAGYPHLYVLDASGKLLQSQDTSELEEGKGYNHDRFAEFLKKWGPQKTVLAPGELAEPGAGSEAN